MTAKDAYYFPHDSNARNDPKMLMLRARHGARGYGVYFMVVEMLREQSDYKLDAGDPELLFASLALGCGEPSDFTKAVIEDCVKFGLLKLNGHLYSDSLMRRLRRYDEIKAKRAEAGRRGAEALHLSRQPHGKGMANSASRRNESRGEENIELPHDLREIIGRSPLTQAEEKLLQLKYPIRGEHHGKRIIDLNAEYCGWALEHLTKAGPQLRAALAARVKLHKAQLTTGRAA